MGLRTDTNTTSTYARQSFKSVESFNLDGLEVARVRSSKGRDWPIRQVLFFIVAVISFKVFLYLEMGGASYNAKALELAGGTMMEKVASWAMTLDPVSAWIVERLQFGVW